MRSQTFKSNIKFIYAFAHIRFGALQRNANKVFIQEKIYFAVLFLFGFYCESERNPDAYLFQFSLCAFCLHCFYGI